MQFFFVFVCLFFFVSLFVSLFLCLFFVKTKQSISAKFICLLPSSLYQTPMEQRSRRAALDTRQASQQRQYTLFSSTPYTGVTMTGEHSLANYSSNLVYVAIVKLWVTSSCTLHSCDIVLPSACIGEHATWLLISTYTYTLTNID